MGSGTGGRSPQRKRRLQERDLRARRAGATAPRQAEDEWLPPPPTDPLTPLGSAQMQGRALLALKRAGSRHTSPVVRWGAWVIGLLFAARILVGMLGFLGGSVRSSSSTPSVAPAVAPPCPPASASGAASAAPTPMAAPCVPVSAPQQR